MGKARREGLGGSARRQGAQGHMGCTGTSPQALTLMVHLEPDRKLVQA